MRVLCEPFLQLSHRSEIISTWKVPPNKNPCNGHISSHLGFGEFGNHIFIHSTNTQEALHTCQTCSRCRGGAESRGRGDVLTPEAGATQRFRANPHLWTESAFPSMCPRANSRSPSPHQKNSQNSRSHLVLFIGKMAANDWISNLVSLVYVHSISCSIGFVGFTLNYLKASSTSHPLPPGAGLHIPSFDCQDGHATDFSHPACLLPLSMPFTQMPESALQNAPLITKHPY